MTSRDVILGRLAPSHAPADRPIRRAPRDHGDVLALLVARLADCGTSVTVCAQHELGAVLSARAGAHAAQRLAVPADLPAAWRPAGCTLLSEDTLSLADLDQVDGSITGCALGVAETGTLILGTGPCQGSRRLTLIPDLHICVVEGRQIVGDVFEAFERLEPAIRARRPLTLVSGPSATSDIELSRVEGVHGPRRLEVVVADG